MRSPEETRWDGEVDMGAIGKDSLAGIGGGIVGRGSIEEQISEESLAALGMRNFGCAYGSEDRPRRKRGEPKSGHGVPCPYSRKNK
jgi:lactate dehydrogenase-like 2-hydroxyacid dehydrogenase